MQKLFIILFLVINMTTTEAQKTAPSPVGEYYLRGVMETASGFKLNEDSTFLFFFSYGALDREGGGTWTTRGNQVILNSQKKHEQDFALVQSKKTEDKQITIRIIDSNQIFLKSVYCIITGDGKKQEALTDIGGFIHFTAQPIDKIELIFEFCQEKVSVFPIEAKDHNYYEFRFEPWMMEVSFKDFSLTNEGNHLSGPHPLLAAETFTYEKAGSK